MSGTAHTDADRTAVDAKARLDALDITQSICVTAPAGSGKTELLTQRLLKLLSVVDRPEQILAITFTRKAAAEMRERIVSSLTLGLNEIPPKQLHKRQTWSLARAVLLRDADKDWHILQNPMRLRIQTIDSLCQSIARDQPLLSRLGGRLQAVDDTTALYQEAVQSFMQQLDTADSIAESIAELLIYFENNVARLEQLFMQMLPIREQWLGHVAYFSGGASSSNAQTDEDIFAHLEHTLHKWIQQALVQARQSLLPHASDLCMAADFAATFLAGEASVNPNSNIRSLQGLTTLPTCTVSEHKQWLGIVELLLTEKFEPRKRYDKNRGFPPKSYPDKLLAERSDTEKNRLSGIATALSDKPDVLDVLRTVALLPAGGYEQQQKKILQPLARCLMHLYAHLQLVFGRSGRCDHVQIANAAIQALDYREQSTEVDPAISYRWHHQIEHVLVDEFQDTSVSQFRLLSLLTDEWPSHNIASPAQSKTLFMVGDGMQSIYSFRQAKVGLFLRARQQGLGDLSLNDIYLKQNFRSSHALVEWVNRHFQYAFPKRDDLDRGAVTYAPAVSFHQAAVQRDEPAIETIACIDDEYRQTEAAQVVSQIQSARQLNPQAEIAILVRARSHLSEILPALNVASIEWQGIDIDLLSQREAVVDCLTLTRALHNPADDIAWYALLRAPWCGLLLKDLQIMSDTAKGSSMSGTAKGFSISTHLSAWVLALGRAVDGQYTDEQQHLLSCMSDEGALRLCAFARRLYQAFAERSRRSVRHWIESVWQAIGGDIVGRYSADGDDTQSVLLFFDVMEEFEQECLMGGERFSLAKFQQRVSKLYARPKILPLVEGQAPPVQIMTIHKAKGLEFDVVILPGLDRTISNSDRPILMSSERIFSDGDSGLVLYPLPRANLLKRDNRTKNKDIYEFLRSEDKAVKDYELLRLFYVAVTRAKTKLVLLSTLDLTEQGEFKAPARASLLAKIWSTIEAEIQVVEPDSQPLASEELDDEFVPQPLKRLTADIYHQIDARLQTEHDNIAAASRATAPDEVAVDTAVIEQTGVLQRAIGSCVHEIFELVVRQGAANWQNIEPVSLQRSYSMRLAQLGVQNQHLKIAQQQVQNSLNNLLTGEVGAWLLNNSHRQLACEWELLDIAVGAWNSEREISYNNVQLEKSIVDLSFIDSDDCRWIIDYKVVEPKSQEDVEGFLLREANNYRTQLERYRRIVTIFDKQMGLTVKEIRCALYFPLMDRLHQVAI